MISEDHSISDNYEDIDILSFISSKEKVKIKMTNNLNRILIPSKIILKIFTLSEISLYEDITKLINFEIIYENMKLFSKENLIWIKIPYYKIYFGIFGFNLCQIEVKDIIKISSMIFKSHNEMAPFIKVSLIKNSSIYLSQTNTFRSLYSERNNLTNSLIKNELIISSNLINNNLSEELIEVTDILGKTHKILKDHLDFTKEQLYLEKINLKDVVIDFFDFPDNKLFTIHKKWLFKEKLIFPSKKKHYVISFAKIKMKNFKKK